MKFYRFPERFRLPVLALCMVLGGLMLLSACSSSSGSGGSASGQPTTTIQATNPPAQTQPSPTSQAAVNTPTQAASSTLEACSLLTKEEVQAAIGKAVNPAEFPIGDPSAVECDYKDPSTNLKSVGLVVYILTPAQAQGVHEATKGGGRDQVAVSGIGDDAYWDKDFNTLDVLKGKYAVSLSVLDGTADERLKAAQTLAPKALARLP